MIRNFDALDVGFT